MAIKWWSEVSTHDQRLFYILKGHSTGSEVIPHDLNPQRKLWINCSDQQQLLHSAADLNVTDVFNNYNVMFKGVHHLQNFFFYFLFYIKLKYTVTFALKKYFEKI